MATQSNNILNTIPRHIVSNYPLFTDFVIAYYEYLEQSGNASDFINNLVEYSNVDGTLDQFLVHFKNQYMSQIPHDVMCDERLLLKHIKELYTSKGSEASYRLLFRALYNKEISFHYPGDSVLRPSDGKWNQDYSICVKIPKTTSLESILECVDKDIKIVGTNGSTIIATLLNVRQLKDNTYTFDDGYHYLEFFLINNLATIEQIKTIT